MTITTRWLATLGIIMLMTGTLDAAGGWKEKVAINQKKVTEYILQLQKGADPDTLRRPYIRHSDNFRAKKSSREMKAAMEKAEILAGAGTPHLIEEPHFDDFKKQ